MSDSFLDMRAGAFRLALRAPLVRGVHRDVSQASASAPLCDLRELFGGERREAVPFAVIAQCGERLVALGVDTVGHLRGVTGRLVPLPRLGLLAPELFEGALRHEGALLLVVQPTAVFERWRRR